MHRGKVRVHSSFLPFLNGVMLRIAHAPAASKQLDVTLKEILAQEDTLLHDLVEKNNTNTHAFFKF